MASPTLADISKARVVVVGDAMIDRWVYGRVERISPEAPIPVFVTERDDEAPGGSANVAANLKALGCADVRSFGSGNAITKTRYVCGSQQILRVDEEATYPISEGWENALTRNIQALNFDVLVISDYAKGTCTPTLCQRLIKWAKENGVKVVVDPKGDNWTKYKGCTVITPNEKEMNGVQAVDWTGKEHMIITRGDRGMTVYEIGKPHLCIPAVNIEPKDVTGCGDTVVATLAACLAVGYDLPEAARIANVAASIAVSKPGTATVSLEELEAALA